MKNKQFNISELNISELLYIGSMLFAVGVLAKVMIERYVLTIGACPIDSNRPLIYLALILIIGVNLGTSIYDYYKKKKIN